MYTNTIGVGESGYRDIVGTARYEGCDLESNARFVTQQNREATMTTTTTMTTMTLTMIVTVVMTIMTWTMTR